MKDVLLVSPFFYPEPISTGKYNSLIAQEIEGSADSVDVLCSHPIYPKWEVEVTDKQLDNVKAIRGGSWLKFPKNALLRRAVLEVWFLFYVTHKLFFSRKRYSHIVAIFPPSLFQLCIPLFKKKAKVVGIVHDLQGVYAKRDANVIKKIIFGAIKFFESIAFKSCDQLIFLSEDMKRVAIAEYDLNKDKSVVHYPFVTIDNFKNSNKLTSIIPDDAISLVYSGALGEKQAPKKLASFLSFAVSNNSNINAYIFSQGPEFEELKKQFPLIDFYSLVEEAQLPELLLRSSIQVIPQESGTSDGSLPSKLPNLLASKCKILCITDPGSELVRLLDAYSRAEVSHEWDNSKLFELTKILLAKENIDSDDQELLDMFTKKSLVERILG